MDITPSPLFLQACREVLDSDDTSPATIIGAMRSPALADAIQARHAALVQNQQKKPAETWEVVFDRSYVWHLAGVLFDEVTAALKADPLLAATPRHQLELQFADMRQAAPTTPAR